MKKLALALLLAGGTSFAQEINDETTASTVMPAAGTLGLRFSLLGGAPTPLGTATGVGVPPSTVGLKFLATDSVGLTFDLGFGMISTGASTFGSFGTGVGVEVFTGQRGNLRPMIVGGVGFSKNLSANTTDFTLGINAGFGAEYFFSKNFSVNGRMLLGLAIHLLQSTSVTQLGTVQPGIGANFYF